MRATDTECGCGVDVERSLARRVCGDFKTHRVEAVNMMKINSTTLIFDRTRVGDKRKVIKERQVDMKKICDARKENWMIT